MGRIQQVDLGLFPFAIFKCPGNLCFGRSDPTGKEMSTVQADVVYLEIMGNDAQRKKYTFSFGQRTSAVIYFPSGSVYII